MNLFKKSVNDAYWLTKFRIAENMLRELQKENENLRKELAVAKRNDNRDPDTGRYRKA